MFEWLRRFSIWMFAPTRHSDAGDVVMWWESRRLAYNLVILAAASGALPVYLWAVESSGRLAPSEDVIEPLAMIAAPVLINIAYTLGWIAECALWFAARASRNRIGPAMMKLDVGFSLLVVMLPALVWGLALLGQVARVAK